MKRDDLVLMGRSSGAFGAKGELRVSSFAEDADLFGEAGLFFAGASPETAQPYHLESLRPHGGRLIFSVKELAAKEDADALKGAWIYLRQSDFPPLEPDEYYWFQVEGVLVSTTRGLELGRVARITAHGAGELWVIRGQEGKEAIIPMTPGVLKELDLEQRTALVDPPEGLLDIQGWDE